MDPTTFDDLTKALATATSRRQALKTLGAALLGALGLGRAETTLAVGCKGQGANCSSSTQCCSHNCSHGKCCPAGYTNCGGTCVNLQTNAHNCGRCGHACASGQVCRHGTCVTPTTTTTTTTSTTTTTPAPCPKGCITLSNGTLACQCSIAADCTCGSKFCGSDLGTGGGVCTVLGPSKGPCTTDSDCPKGYYCNGSGNCDQACC